LGVYSFGLGGDRDFTAKRAVVTGGGRGLGRALVLALAEAGADVAFSFLNSREAAAEVEDGAKRFGRRVHVGRADARAPGQMAAFVEEAALALGGIDLLVNNVGLFQQCEIEELSEEALDDAWDVNCKAAVMTSRAAAPHMRASGGGAIVNIASLGGLRPWTSHLAYCASKAALLMATEVLARALAPLVRVNAVAPGILTPPGADEALRQRIPLGRFGSHDDVVDAVFYLAHSTYTTGQVLVVDGGRALA
jgi:NAD(P)-dependent dehydrogenase (short-subunit alcohol dehydrogenase family)